jgi:outer membrane protein assembly factor BamB
MKYALLLLLFSSIAILSCDRYKVDPPPPPPTDDSTKLKVVWRRPFPSDQLYGSCVPAIYGDKVIFSNYPSVDPEKFYAFDKETGKQQFWVWEDYLSEGANRTSPTRLPTTLDNILCLAPGNGFIGVDMNTGNTIWKSEFKSNMNKNRFETCLVAEHNINDTTVGAKFVDIKTGSSRDILIIDTLSSSIHELRFSNIERNADNDTIWYFGISQLYADKDGYFNDTRSTFYAYNITQRKVLWHNSQMYVPGTGSIVGDNIVVIDKGVLICFNKMTGEKIWEQPYPAQAVHSMVQQDDYLILLDFGSPGLIHAYNKFTGKPVWKIPYAGNPSTPIFHKGLMYFTAQGLLWAIRVSNGELVWKEVCPDRYVTPGSTWTFGVNVDPTTNKLYVSSLTGAFCLEPAE